MKTINHLFALALLSLFLGCGLFEEENPCGDGVHEFFQFNNNGNFGINQPTFTTIRDKDRVFQWSTPIFENVCPKKHIDVLATFQLEASPLIPITTRVKGDYAFFFEVDIPLKEESITETSLFKDYDGDFGIKHAFDPDPGWFSVKIEIAFNTTGNFQQDSLYLLDVWENISLSVFYKNSK